jgi:hypothetical protein
MADILGSLTNIFTGQPGIDASQQQQQYLQQQAALTNSRIQAAQGTGIGALQSGQQGAIGAIGAGQQAGENYIQGSIDPSVSALYGGQGSGVGALTQGQQGGLAALQSGVMNAVNAYSPVSNIAGGYGAANTQAQQAQSDALGLNGPEGYARAVSQFQAGPGYQFQLGQGVDAATRAASAAGGGNAFSGNTLKAAQDYGSNLANQTYQQYLGNLQSQQGLYAPLALQGASTAAQGVGGANLTGATAGANVYTGTGQNLANLYSNTGQNVANTYGTAGQNLANIAYGGGVQQGNVYSGTGQSIANLVSGLSGQQTSYTGSQNAAYDQAIQEQAQAELGGSQNLWNLIGGGAKLAAGSGFLPSGSNTPWNVGSSSVRT